MARYIDADALIDRIKRDVITLSKDAAECKEFMIKHIAMDWFAPTANVAPMEEVERLHKEVDRLSQVVLYHEGITQMEVDEAKADTVKKMQERLHSTMCDIPTKYCARTDYSLYYRFGDWVDDIAKEILEGGDTE